MIDESNPAGRLHGIFQSVKANKDQTPMREVWAKALDLPAKDDSKLIKAVIEVYALSQEVQKLIQLREGNNEVYLSSFKSLESAIFPLNLDAQYHNFRKHVNEEAITRLQFCAHLLARFYTEESITKEEIEDISSKVDELYKIIESSNLSEEIRLIFLQEMSRIRTAISYYKISGAKGVKESLQATVGAVFANQDALKAESEKNKEVISRVGELIDKLDSFTARALKLHKILKNPIKTLIGAISEPEESKIEVTEA